MKFIVHGRKFDRETRPFIETVLNTLVGNGSSLSISEDFNRALKKSGIALPADYEIYKQSTGLLEGDFFLSLGGDGTFLESATHIGAKEIPMLGINTGRLGFLASTKKTDIEAAIADLIAGSYTLERRTLLKLVSSIDIFGQSSFALNEFTILKKDTSSMIVVDTFIDGDHLSSYWADGLIVATATGSTGYSLSCGGPVILPQSDNFVITPVSPHNLTMRPVVVSSNSVVSFKIGGRDRNFLVSLDSRSSSVDASVEMSVRKEQFGAVLVKRKGQIFFDTLREKLNWGLDLRN